MKSELSVCDSVWCWWSSSVCIVVQIEPEIIKNSVKAFYFMIPASEPSEYKCIKLIKVEQLSAWHQTMEHANHKWKPIVQKSVVRKKKTYDQILRHFFWLCLKRNVVRYVKSCHICQVAGKPNQTIPSPPLYPIRVVCEPSERVLFDCVDPLLVTSFCWQWCVSPTQDYHATGG